MLDEEKNSDTQIDLTKPFTGEFLTAGDALRTEKITLKFERSLALPVVDELAKGLTVGMSPSLFTTNYKSIIENRESLGVAIGDVADRFKVVSSVLADFNTRIAGPVSASIASIGILGTQTNVLLRSGEVQRSSILATQRVLDSSIGITSFQKDFATASITLAETGLQLKDIGDTIAPSLGMISTGLNQTLKSLTFYPQVNDFIGLKTLESAITLKPTQIEREQSKLDKQLVAIGHPELVELRQGSWEALSVKVKDYHRHAFASMRSLVDEVLRIIAPDEDVKKSPYYHAEGGKSTTTNKPTRRARLQYALQEKSTSKHNERLIRDFISNCEQLAAMSHTPVKHDGFARGVLLCSEGVLIALLTQVENLCS